MTCMPETAGAPEAASAPHGATGAFLRRLIARDDDSVRVLLLDLTEVMAASGVALDDRAAAELVLAEVFNNIVEHGYATEGYGVVEVRLGISPAGLDVGVVDCGAALPGGALPAGSLADLDHALPDLPEGGFGWFLIRSLVQRLRYRRDAGGNSLQFFLAFATTGASR